MTESSPPQNGQAAQAPQDAGVPQDAEKRKALIREILLELAGLAHQAGLATTARDIRDVRIPKLEEERFSLVVIGEFNHGKSTFLNAILKADVLPVGATPTTAALAEIKHGARFRADAVFADGTRKQVARDDVGDWLRGKAPGSESEMVERIEISLDSPFLVDQLTVVDTPGVNDLSEQRADITYGYVPRADAIIFLLDATQVLSASERAFLQERVLRDAHDRLLFVIAKADLLDADERIEVGTFVREQLAAIVPDPIVFFVSAKQALQRSGADDAGGMQALREHLAQTLGRDRRRLVLDHALADAGRLVRFVRQSFGMRRASLALTPTELKQRIERAQQRLADGKRALGEANETIRAEAAALRARVQQDLGAVVEDLAASLPAEVEQTNPADVEAYLGPFLEDTFKTWVEQEGEMMAATLEALAEKVVAIASERLETIGEHIAHDLGLQDEDLKVQTPTLNLEASVFALGVLGTTALVFVHTLMGGVVALLTPALAALVRARAARTAKGEAVRRAPELVRKLGAELSPRLDLVVDEFADRLEAFIAEAGAALARGITEVLQSALDARTNQDDGQGGKQAGKQEGKQDGKSGNAGEAIEREIEKLAGIQARIDRARQSVWDSSID